MKLSKAVSAAVLAAAAVAGSSGAFAAIDPGTAPSDLFIAIWNPGTSTSIVQDLGATPYSTAAGLGNSATFDNLSSGPYSWTIDNGNLAADLGSGTYQYQIFAADNTASTTYFGNSAYLSIVAGATPPDPLNSELIQNGISSISAYLQDFLGGSTTIYKGTLSGPTGAGNVASYWAAAPNGDGNTDSFTMNTLANLGGDVSTNPLNLVQYVGGGTPSADSPTASTVVSVAGNGTSRGVFRITGDTLNYSVSTVPLPPAGWLLISGILGLLAVSRRRGTEAV